MAEATAEELRQKVESHVFPNAGHITVSLGVISVQTCVDQKRVYTIVDNALYKAKVSGRNRYVVAHLPE